MKLVNENSEDATSKAKGGDFGTFSRADNIPDQPLYGFDLRGRPGGVHPCASSSALRFSARNRAFRRSRSPKSRDKSLTN